MLTSDSRSGANPLGQSIDYYFELALYLLVASAFVTLVSTGGLDLPSIVVMTVALLTRGCLFIRHERVMISERWTTPLTLIYFVFFALDYFVVSRGFLPATVHLALFGVTVRMFSLRRERDYILLAVLAFLMVLVSAVLTVGSAFLFSFTVFMLMAVATFILLEMHKSGQAAAIQPESTGNPREPRMFASSLARVAPALMGMILVGAAGLFFLLPRKSAGYLGGYAFGTDFSSGFSDHVQLGQIGQIQQSNAVVMHVQIDGDRTGRYDMRWRGVALGDFDGRVWSKPRQQFELQKWGDNSFEIPRVDPEFQKKNAVEQTIHYRVLMEPIGTNVFFLAPWAESISGAYQALAIDMGGAVYDFDNLRAISRYEADSDVSRPTAAELRGAGEDYPREIIKNYLQFPRATDPRVPQLARQIVGSAKTPYDKAALIEGYLRSHFGYTLELPGSMPSDPIANFLFERKQGHCEYFASSMAIMLRTLGIPSRVVNGFRSDEFNDITGNYVVRAKDAHAWVEAFFPGYGWQTFDATPAGGSGVPQGWRRIGLYVDAMASFWREWIISYDTSHQYVLGQGALNATHNFWESTRNWARGRYQSILKWGRKTEDEAQHSPTEWILGTIILSLAFLLARNAEAIARLIHEYRLRTHPERSPEEAAAMWYGRMVRVVARRGIEKAAQQTPAEFVKQISDGGLREQVGRFTEGYEAARFGNSPEDAESLPQLYENVEAATRDQ